jgi:hypothetical protein
MLGNKSVGSPRQGINGGRLKEEKEAEEPRPPGYARATLRPRAYSFVISHRMLEFWRAPLDWNVNGAEISIGRSCCSVYKVDGEESWWGK